MLVEVLVLQNIAIKFKEHLEVSGELFFEEFVHEDVLFIIYLWLTSFISLKRGFVWAAEY